MPHVMKTRLETSSIAALHVGPTTQLVKNSVCRSSCNRIPVTADEEWSIQPARMRFASLIGIGRKYVDKIWAKRYESCLVELALPNRPMDRFTSFNVSASASPIRNPAPYNNKRRARYV